ncbi:hypothetical protein BCR33DRAFT_210846 [Rhizoclosmatium globosum]|uniref:Uncharacterized protein n=1 Tax=Rhizoclosmatium globosum TaxID=329046 RepID=A0A1Y2CCS5_9FUNG|nr:hypothetical protein BCR33DRAFT_210846 [Rhizoclosmatium globosum]|eukprot:ORY44833.1 hypothetical protein BCR33DRAFT_210846 [Rhizoclosmatium globosum]
MEPRNTLFPTLKQIIKPRFSEPSFAQQSPRSSDESLSPTGSGLGRGGSATQSQSTAIVAESATTAPPPPPTGTTATTSQSIPPKVPSPAHSPVHDQPGPPPLGLRT